MLLYDRSPLKINLNPILADCIPILASFLRKNHRALRLSTLQCLDVLVKHYGMACIAALGVGERYDCVRQVTSVQFQAPP